MAWDEWGEFVDPATLWTPDYKKYMEYANSVQDGYGGPDSFEKWMTGQGKTVTPQQGFGPPQLGYGPPEAGKVWQAAGGNEGGMAGWGEGWVDAPMNPSDKWANDRGYSSLWDTMKTGKGLDQAQMNFLQGQNSMNMGASIAPSGWSPGGTPGNQGDIWSDFVARVQDREAGPSWFGIPQLGHVDADSGIVPFALAAGGAFGAPAISGAAGGGALGGAAAGAAMGAGSSAAQSGNLSEMAKAGLMGGAAGAAGGALFGGGSEVANSGSDFGGAGVGWDPNQMGGMVPSGSGSAQSFPVSDPQAGITSQPLGGYPQGQPLSQAPGLSMTDVNPPPSGLEGMSQTSMPDFNDIDFNKLFQNQDFSGVGDAMGGGIQFDPTGQALLPQGFNPTSPNQNLGMNPFDQQMPQQAQPNAAAGQSAPTQPNVGAQGNDGLQMPTAPQIAGGTALGAAGAGMQPGETGAFDQQGSNTMQTNPVTGGMTNDTIFGGNGNNPMPGNGMNGMQQFLNSLGLGGIGGQLGGGQQQGNGLGSFLGGVGDMFAANKYRQDLMDLTREGMAKADPFASQRAGYQQQFQQYNQDPNFFQNDSVMQGMQNNALRQVESRDATRGYLGSGNMLHDVARTATETAAPYMMQRGNQLMQAGGGNINPGGIAQMMGSMSPMYAGAGGAQVGGAFGAGAGLGSLAQNGLQGVGNMIGNGYNSLKGLFGE